MKTKIMSGRHIAVAAPHDVAPGDGVLAGAVFGIACGAAAKGASVTICLDRDVFTLPKAPRRAWEPLVAIYWDAEKRQATTVAKGNRLIGAAFGAATAEDATAPVVIGAAG